MPYNMMTYGWGMNGFWAFLFWPIIIWSLAWKGIALWKAAKQSEKGWFVALLIINTAGILEILYIYFFSKKKGMPKQ